MLHESRQIGFIFVATISLALFLSSVDVGMAAEAPILDKLKEEDRERVANLIKGARRDGAVNILNALFSEHTEKLLSKTFRELYALGNDFKFTNIRKGTGRLVDIAEQEMRTNQLTFDIVIVSSLPFYIEAVKAGNLDQYTSPYWREFGFDNTVSKLKQVADPPHFVTPFAYAFQPVWNRKCKGFKDVNITSYLDLLNPKFQHMTIVSDVPKSSTYSSLWLMLQQQEEFVYYKGQKLNFIDYMKRFHEITAPMVLFRTEDKMKKLISCVRALDMWNLAGRVHQSSLQDSTLDLAVGAFQEGMMLHGNYMAIPRGVPHPDAAKLFYDFLLRPEGQTELVRGEAVYSLMMNFTPPPEVHKLITPISEFKHLFLEESLMTNERLKEAHREWKDIFLK